MDEDRREVRAKALKAGTETSEYQVVRSSERASTLALVLGAIVSVGPYVLQAGEGTAWGPLAGTLIAVAGLVQRVFVGRRYIDSRTELKK